MPVVPAPNRSARLSMSQSDSIWHYCVTSGWRRSRPARCRRGCGAPMPAASCGRTDRRGDFRRRQLGGDPHAKIRHRSAGGSADCASSRPPCRRTARSASSGCAGFGAGVGRALPCMCAHRAHRRCAAILVVATERAGPELALDERARVCWPDATNRSRPSRPMASSFTPRPRPRRGLPARPRSPPSALPHWRPAPPTASAPQARSSTGRSP